ncbi:MAG: transcription factor S [Nanoarchaeota archaeon]
MEFCPRCGAVLIKKKKNAGCPRCNYSSKEKIKLTTSEKTSKKIGVVVVSSRDTETLPIVEEKCRECGNEKSYFWTVQTRAGDEAETKFFKCTKCGNTWRQYR